MNYFPCAVLRALAGDCAEASARAGSSRKDTVTVIPNFFMETFLPMGASYASPALDITKLLQEPATQDL